MMVDRFNISMKAVLFTLLMATLLMSAPALAQVDTAEEGLQNIEDWMTQWIPILATLAIMAAALAWMTGFARMDLAIRIILGLIVIGSASYLVGLFL